MPQLADGRYEYVAQTGGVIIYDIDDWCEQEPKIEIRYIQPGKPTQLR